MSLEDVMIEASKQGYNVDEKTIRNNIDYFKHNLNLCACSICQCGTCRCNGGRFRLNTSYRRRSTTPKSGIPDTPITVSRNTYETYENTNRQINGLPTQFLTNNQIQYKGLNIFGTPINTHDIKMFPSNPFEGNTRYNEFFTEKPKQQKIYFKRPYERHTGPLKSRFMETHNQKAFRKVKLDLSQQVVPQVNQVEHLMKVNFSIPMNTMYQSFFKDLRNSTESVDRKTSKVKRLEDLQSINQINLPFQARTTTSQSYRQSNIFVCPAKIHKVK